MREASEEELREREREKVVETDVIVRAGEVEEEVREGVKEAKKVEEQERKRESGKIQGSF